MIKLFSLKNQQQNEANRGSGGKKASAAQLRVQKGKKEYDLMFCPVPNLYIYIWLLPIWEEKFELLFFQQDLISLSLILNTVSKGLFFLIGTK